MNRKNLKFGASIVALLVAQALLAQQQSPSPIDTERPDYTNSPSTMAVGKLQLESGLSYARSSGVKTWDGPELLVRYGLKPSWEFQFGSPNYVSIHADAGNTSGWGDSYFGLKHQWTSEGAPITFGTTAYVTAPTGNRDFTSDAWDGGVQILAAGDLGHNWSLGTMLQLSQFTEGGTKNKQAFLSASAGYQMTDKVQPFFELAGATQKYGSQQALFQTGFLYRMDNDHQWDVHTATRLDHNSSSFWNAGVGYSVRF